MFYKFLIFSFSFCLFLVCDKTDSNQTQGDTLSNAKTLQAAESYTCSHKLMQVRILPHPPNFLEMKDIQYCFYKREKNKYSFYRTLFPGEKPLTIGDRDSIVW